MDFLARMVNQLGPNAYHTVNVLLRHMCIRVADKSDYRTHASSAVVEVLQTLPPDQQSPFIDFLLKYAKNGKAGFRLFAVEVAKCTLQEYLKPKDEAKMLTKPSEVCALDCKAALSGG